MKLGLLQECIRDCNRAIQILPSYVKAWYRRGKANESLKKYRHAKDDLEVALSMEDNLSKKSQIKGEFNIVLNKCNNTNVVEMVMDGANEKVDSLVKSQALELQCVSTPNKGRGLTSATGIPPSSLVHYEQPLAAILLKAYRETHCHFCFNQVTADVLFCPSCTIPVYCSVDCQEQALGNTSCRIRENYSIMKNLSANLQKHVIDSIFTDHVNSIGIDVSDNHIPEHRHECKGAHWSAVLPPDIVLAGRLMVTAIEKWNASGRASIALDYLDFVHNYAQNPSVRKLESHVYAVVLAYCLNQYTTNSDFLLSGASVAQLILVISQVRVNSMAIVHMKSVLGDEALRRPFKVSNFANCSTQCTEQVRVAQAIYSRGSLFNHSCKPNVHAYFLSRALFVRSTELISAWSPLELSYGPQVGQLAFLDRQRLLEEQYSFRCCCSSCSEMNLTDLVIYAFRCNQPSCPGAVLDASHFKTLDHNLIQVYNASHIVKISLPLPDHGKDISNVARMLFHERGANIVAGQCLNCGSYCNLERSTQASKRSIANIQRLKGYLDLDKVPQSFISDILNSLSHVRSVRHQYSKCVAEAEDNVAETLARIGELEQAVQHCIASIKILEKLYHSNHIVMGHELMKLASIQLCLDDPTNALNSIERVESIFSLHYGYHVDKIFPHLKILRREAARLAP